MKKQIFSITGFAAAALLAFTFTSCGDDKKTDNGTLPNGSYNTSDDVAADNLVAKFSFENDVTDAKGNITGGAATGTSFVAGAKGQAWQGASAGYVLYSGVSSKVTGMESTTISTWVKTAAVSTGAESWFQLLNDSNFWGNFFVLQESGNSGNDSTRIKFTICKMEDKITYKEQWSDLSGLNRIKIADNTWHHVVCSYDALTSKIAVYVDGVKINLPANMTDKFTNDPTKGGEPLGSLKFKNATKFVFGCYKQNLPGGAPDTWMKNFTGALDEFRLYNKALADADVTALYQLEKAGR